MMPSSSETELNRDDPRNDRTAGDSAMQHEHGNASSDHPGHGQAGGTDDHPPSKPHRSSEREKEREHEDEAYVPVIVKRSDEARRHPDDTLQLAVKEGLEQLRRNGISLTLSSMAAGMILGFTAMSVAMAAMLAEPFDSWLVTRAMTALVYPLGFVMCVLSGTQLFTEHTATAVYPVLDTQAKVSQLLRLWAIVIGGNLVGAGISAGMLTVADPVIRARNGYLAVGHHLVEFDTLPLVFSSVLAGWLMAQGAWLTLGTSHTSGQILAIYIATFLIGIGGLHHSIAGSVELFAALLAGAPYRWTQALHFIGCALFGNLIGGSTFVAVLNYTQIRGATSNQQGRAADDHSAM